MSFYVKVKNDEAKSFCTLHSRKFCPVPAWQTLSISIRFGFISVGLCSKPTKRDIGFYIYYEQISQDHIQRNVILFRAFTSYFSPDCDFVPAHT